MMENGFRTAYVYVRDAFAGELCETDAGYTFRYDIGYLNDEAAPAISLTLPKKEESYFSTTMFPFFDGLIPEGWLLSIVTHSWKISERDRFGLLLIACKDCVGAVSVREEKL